LEGLRVRLHGMQVRREKLITILPVVQSHGSGREAFHWVTNAAVNPQ
jgi:hypothetical protein